MQGDYQRPERLDEPFHVLRYHERYGNEELIKYLAYRPGLIVLDCRCGEGVLLDQLVGRAGTACGVDRSVAKLRQTPLPRLVSAAASERLPFASNVFDSVISRDPLHHAFDPVRLLEECARVLRPGGQLVLWESRRSCREGSRVDLERAMCAAGFRPVAQEPFDYLAYPAAVLASKVPLLARSSLGMALVKVFLALDGKLARSAACQDRSWHLIIVAEKGKPA